MTEEQLNNIATYMATANNEEQFIYMCEIGIGNKTDGSQSHDWQLSGSSQYLNAGVQSKTNETF